MKEPKPSKMGPLASLLAILICGGLVMAQASRGRRAWAEGLSEELPPAALAGVLQSLHEPDVVFRGQLIEYLGRVLLAEPASRQRLSALSDLALHDGDLGLRREALRALARVADRPALRELLGLLPQVGREQREQIARLLADELAPTSPEAGEALENLVRAGFQSAGPRTAADVLTLLLPAYGRRLAERSEATTSARDRAPLVLGRQHPDPFVQRAAARALEVMLDRLRALERFERAERLLEQLAEDGVAPSPLLFLRAVGLLHEGTDSLDEVLRLVEQLDRSGVEALSVMEGRWRSRAALLEANAALALDRHEQAGADLRRAADLCQGMLALRLDRHGKRGALWHRDRLFDSALIELGEAFLRLAKGAQGDDPELLAHLRKAHMWLLKGQLVAVEADLPRAVSIDLLFAEVTSPYRCIFAIRPHRAWPAERVLKAQRTLGRALASISARELPGLRPYTELMPERADPLSDPSRRGLLNRIARARVQAVERELAELRLRLLRRMDMDPALGAQRARLEYELKRMQLDLSKPLGERFFDLRQPSAYALLLADAMRREDQNLEARQVAQRLFEDLESNDLRQKYAWAVQLSAQAKLSIGGSFSDMNQPARAEELMGEGLELFEYLQGFYEERGASAAASAVDDDLAEALVSLAVNANVKAGDPARAAEFFERAYGLRQDDFMRVLLACYRARSGEREKALALLEGVPYSPAGYYNLACTYALLGEAQRALEWLELDFSVNRTSAAALEKQRAWARADPDLASLRGDPAFELLTASAPPPKSTKGGD